MSDGERRENPPGERPLCPCEVCGAKVPELRRNRCWGCYSKWVESRPVGLGAACAMCGERRRTHLKMIELLRAWVPICHNCAVRATQLSPMPQHIDEIRRILERDRRAAERREGRPDTRVYPRDRRGLDRRGPGHAEFDDFLLLDENDIIIEDLEETKIVPSPGSTPSTT